MRDGIVLEYGHRELAVELPDGARVVRAPAAPPGREVAPLLREALDAPIAADPLESRKARRPLVIVSDATRADPRNRLLNAAVERLPEGAELVVAVANGTHAPGDPGALDLPAEVLERARLVNHDSRDASALVELGVTARGTPVVVHRCVTECDLIIATGCIRPHYFAGYGAGVKSIFPGLGEERAIRTNHRLKSEPGARTGVVEGNPCREDLEDALSLVPAPAFLLNLVLDGEGGAQAAVAGDVRAAFRRGAEACAPFFQVRAAPRRLVVVADRLPVTGSLYQASKLVAAAAPLVAPGGTVALVAPCPDGTGPLETVNRGIYEIGLAPRLPEDHRVVLISDLSREEVEATYCEWAPSLEAVIEEVGEPPLVLPRAAGLIAEREAAA